MNFKSLILTACGILAAFQSACGLSYVNPSAPEFPILAWYSILPDSAQTKQRYDELREAGFNISFSHFDTNEQVQRALDVAQGSGIKIMATSYPILTDTKISVEKFRDHPALAGWFLRDEPTASGFKFLSDYRDRIAESDTTHLLYLNLLPSIVSPVDLETRDYEEYVERYINEVRIPLVSFDMYPIIYDEDTRTVQSREDNFYENFEIASKVAKRHGIPFWAFCMVTAHKPYTVPTAVHINYEAFTALAYGAQGIQYFTYWQPPQGTWDFHNAPIDETGKRTDVYYLVREQNREIQALAPIFLGMETDDVSFIGENLPKGTKPLSQLPEGFGPASTDGIGVLVSQFHNGDDRYLMLVNRDIHHAQTVTLPRPAGLSKIERDGTATPDSPTSTIILPPGYYHLLKL